MKIFFILMVYLFSFNAHAVKNDKNLFYQADKNNVQVLPQRFEYAILDEDRLKIGDILIDTSKLSFDLQPASQGKFKLTFKWPAALLQDGNIILKNNVGKALFDSEFNKENIKIIKAEPIEGETDLRNDSAEYSTMIENKLVQDLKYLPFVKFCIFKEDAGTRIYLCSKELYMSTANAQMVVKSRNSNRNNTSVEVNSQTVGDQGLIFLNDSSELLVMKAFTKNGAQLEIETRKKDVDFKDVFNSEDGTSLVFTATGAEPVDPSKVKKINSEEWQISVPKTKPVVYLKGEGDIPMRQEFFIKGDLPSDKNKIYLSENSKNKTYSHNMEIFGKLPDGFSATSTEANSKLLTSKNGNFKWVWSNLNSNKKNRRYLTVKNADQKWTAGYDVEQVTPAEIYIGLNTYTSNQAINANLGFNWWFENFLSINSEATYLHWGASLKRAQHLSTKTGEPKLDITQVELLYRLNPGFYMQDETWGLNLPIGMISTDSNSIQTFGIGAFWHKKAPTSLSKYASWFNSNAVFFLPGGSDLKLKQGLSLSTLANKKLNDLLWLTYGGGISQYTFDPKSGQEPMQINIEIGTAYRF